MKGGLIIRIGTDVLYTKSQNIPCRPTAEKYAQSTATHTHTLAQLHTHIRTHT